jgi:hypothetical protein
VIDRHIFSAAKFDRDRVGCLTATAFGAPDTDFERERTAGGVAFAIWAASHWLTVEQAGSCGRQRLRIWRRKVSGVVAPSRLRKLRVMHPSNSIRASSRFWLWSASGAASEVRSTNPPNMLVGIIGFPDFDKSINHYRAISIARCVKASRSAKHSARARAIIQSMFPLPAAGPKH